MGTITHSPRIAAGEVQRSGRRRRGGAQKFGYILTVPQPLVPLARYICSASPPRLFFSKLLLIWYRGRGRLCFECVIRVYEENWEKN